MGGKGGECKCDNNTVVMVIKHGYTKEKHMAHLLWCLFFLEAKFNVTLVTTHVPGAKNLVADALSHNRLMEFFTLNSTGQAPAISGTTSPGMVNFQKWMIFDLSVSSKLGCFCVVV